MCGFHAAISSSQRFDWPDRMAQNGDNLSIWRKLLLPANRIVIGVLIISSLAASKCSARSRRDARHAGTIHAIAATANSIAETAAKTAGSSGLTEPPLNPVSEFSEPVLIARDSIFYELTVSRQCGRRSSNPSAVPLWSDSDSHSRAKRSRFDSSSLLPGEISFILRWNESPPCTVRIDAQIVVTTRNHAKSVTIALFAANS